MVLEESTTDEVWGKVSADVTVEVEGSLVVKLPLIMVVGGSVGMPHIVASTPIM